MVIAAPIQPTCLIAQRVATYNFRIANQPFFKPARNS